MKRMKPRKQDKQSPNQYTKISFIPGPKQRKFDKTKQYKNLIKPNTTKSYPNKYFGYAIPNKSFEIWLAYNIKQSMGEQVQHK